MSQPSNWPLPANGIRFALPQWLREFLAAHPITAGLYPLSFGHYRHAKGHRMQRSEHDNQLLIYCTEGGGEVRVNQRSLAVRPGDLVLLRNGLPHAYAADARDPWSIYWVHFDGHLSQAFVDALELSPQDPRLPLGHQSRLIGDFQQFLEARRTGYNRQAFIHASLMLQQILGAVALLRPQIKARHQGGFDLEQVHSLMQQHIHEQLDLDTLAAQVNLSKYHFAKRYKELTGTSPINHFIHLKIEYACQLLDLSDKSVKEIGYAVGYEDAYYFSRLFKKVLGLSPSQYRSSRPGS